MVPISLRMVSEVTESVVSVSRDQEGTMKFFDLSSLLPQTRGRASTGGRSATEPALLFLQATRWEWVSRTLT
jgi:hypothetical protein